ncbi:fungal specific transcription factor domain-containing protein [Purpureocillium lilacinum]|uniref:Fungal specific transcription factor domain-containing protein n=1 Tax=Purpureocillium lilacinum TaxID=33203 RepID=A0A179GQ02_PURLI|nr:fungal specific transcription factor domain-containing protein [Purpureocillium lilacinum]OAQ79440.1 fungal specific transcription factor domain-containing protein [Purpureocillium lilacinum]
MATSFDFNSMARRADAGDAANMPSPPSPVQHDAPSHHPHHPSNVTVYQTTGPDAHTGPILAPGSGAPALNPRSCVTCRRRKVRCDKQMPCSNCRRALIPCVFPAPGRAPRQQRPKDPNAPPKNSTQREVELIKRLRKLEGIVEELSGQIEVESGKAPSTASSPTGALEGLQQRQGSGSLDYLATGSPLSRNPDSTTAQDNEAAMKKDMQKNFGRMVLDDHSGTRRYVSSGFWSKLNDELDSIREETQRLTDEDADDSEYEGTPTDSPATGVGSLSDHHSFVLGYRSADVSLKKCHPLPSHVTFLWSVYQENVEPLVKLLHVPTTDLVMREARRNSDKLSPGNEALAFAIYFAAITSLEPEEVETNFGSSKDELLAQYRFALEQSLAKANFLDTSDIAVVQAFAMFLIVVRRHDESRFCWALTGLLIRIAQGLGIHRDGTHFNLSPFDTEIRRRLWWAILMLDLRSAEELGTDMTVGERSYDTKIPSNINDADISPESIEPPAPREGRSDAAVSIVRAEICILSRRLVTASSAMASLCPKVDEGSLEDREAMLIDVYRRIENKFLQHVLDETDPLYWVAAMIARVIMAKMCLVIYQPMLFPGSNYELSSEIRQRIYVAAIEVIEYGHKLNTDPRCKQYRWLFKTYTNWHAIAYTLIESCRRPWTALVERGWEAVNGYDKDPVEIAKRADHAAVFLPLRKLFIRARRHRESEIARLKANQEEARRLDFAERMNPAQARFGPVPGAENRMEQIREKWRMLTRPDGASPSPYTFASQQPSTGAPSAAEGTALAGSMSTDTTQSQHLKPPGDPVPLQMDLSFEAMQYMDDLMSQPNLNIAEFYNVAGDEPKNANLSSTASPMPGFPNRVTEQQEAALRQQALTLQTQPPKDSHVPPYLWSDPFTVMNTKFEDSQVVEDTDMLGDDFNWQDWSQSIRGLEMESTDPQKGW